jgi:hypothetical protein
MRADVRNDGRMFVVYKMKKVGRSLSGEVDGCRKEEEPKKKNPRTQEA